MNPHRELRCTNPSCTYDMRDDDETNEAVYQYLIGLAGDVDERKVRHVSVSVHRGHTETDSSTEERQRCKS